MMKDRSAWVSRARQALDIAFLALLGVYLLYLTAGITTFNIPFPEWFERRLLAVMAAAALLRLPFLDFRRADLPPKLLAGALLAALYGLVYNSDGYDFLLFLAVATVGLIDVDYRRALKMYLLTAGLLTLAAVVAALTGAITNYVFMKNGYIRSAWGIIYPTDFASAVLYALLALWVACRRLPDWVMLGLSVLSTLMAWFIVHGTTSCLCSAALTGLVAYRVFERQVIERRGRLKWVGRGVDWLATLAFPLLACAMFALMLLYRRDVGLAHRVNNLMTGRLKLAVNAWRQNGITAFGAPFEQVGAGGSTFQPKGYNFVDSSYPLILIRYGWAALAAMAAMWVLGVRRAIRIRDRRLVLAMALVALHSFSEHHFTEINFNILLAMPLAAYLPLPEASEAPRAPRKGRGWALAATCAACAGLLALVPAGFSLLRTAFQALAVTGGGKRSLAVIAAILCALAVVAAFVRALYGLLKALFGGRGVSRRALAALIACAVLAGGAALACGGLIGRADRDNAELLAAEAPALEAVTASADGRVYSDILPEVYRRRFGGISRSALSGEDLARLYGVTVVMDAGAECNPFFESGFLYTQISDAHAIYTNDVGAIDALRAAGYHLTGYYNNVKSADMQFQADINGLDRTADGGVALVGGARAMACGPYADLYDGSYTVRYDLRLSDETLADAAIRSGDAVCELKLTAYWGQEPLLTKRLTRKRFGDDGALTVEVPFTVESCRAVEFQAYAAQGCGVIVEGVSWRRTPEYDVHAYYDAQRRRVRDEYYSLDGEPILTGQGYFACEYGYDDDGNRAVMRYLDQDGAPVVISTGYAERRRVYNVKRQVVRMEYYGADGQPVLVKGGYAALERTYDDAGNVTSQRYFGVDGQPVTTEKGYSELRREYNADRKVTREAYYGADGQPILQKDGSAAVEREYDAAGNAAVVRYYGADGAPVVTTHGYAEMRRRFNGMRQVEREAYYGANGEPMARENGAAVVEKEYDDAGNVSVLRYYGADGAPVVTTRGYAELRRTYIKKKQVARAEYYGADGELLAQKSGAAIVEQDFDAAGNVTAVRYYGADGAPVVTERGYAELRRTYNKKRKVTRAEYYGADGKLLAQKKKKGAAIIERDYDAAGNLTATRYYGADGALIREKKAKKA